MPRDITRAGGRRTQRQGAKRGNVFRPSQGPVMRLNEGSSPHQRSSRLQLNQPGGSFGSGRPAGGGLAAALAGLPPSVVGEPEIGPGPVEPGPLPPVFEPEPPSGPQYPNFPFPEPPTQASFPEFPFPEPPTHPSYPRYFNQFQPPPPPPPRPPRPPWIPY